MCIRDSPKDALKLVSALGLKNVNLGNYHNRKAEHTARDVYKRQGEKSSLGTASKNFIGLPPYSTDICFLFYYCTLFPLTKQDAKPPQLPATETRAACCVLCVFSAFSDSHTITHGSNPDEESQIIRNSSGLSFYFPIFLGDTIYCCASVAFSYNSPFFQHFL